MKKNSDPSGCPVDFAFKRIGGKYKGRIIWYIAENNNLLRYGQLRKMISGITAKMLTQTLRELEEDKLLSRKVYQEVPPRVEYSLTETGKELIPFIEQLKKWGENHM